jgi:hypothetical protein
MQQRLRNYRFSIHRLEVMKQLGGVALLLLCLRGVDANTSSGGLSWQIDRYSTYTRDGEFCNRRMSLKLGFGNDILRIIWYRLRVDGVCLPVGVYLPVGGIDVVL